MESLPVVNSTTNFEDIAKIIGQDEPQGSANNMFYLKINRDHEDDSGNTLPAGSWSVSLPDKMVYAKEIDFQVFVQRYQYLHYDAEVNEMVNKSVMAKNLYPQTEIPDILGTFRCGSVPASQREALSTEKALQQKNIKCFRMLFGKATFIDAVDEKGAKVEDAVDVPILWRARGSNFMPISVPIDSLSAQKKPFIFYKLRASLDKKKNGGLVYYVGKFNNSPELVDFTPGDQDTLAYFMDYINDENGAVIKKYDNSLRTQGKIVDQEPITVTANDLLNDDLPESLVG
jgi:hypothetical protein|tara:strand:+ start:994 stop:1854 length:861 start_codon:yes stop_codon:yes gene_type:complete